LPEHIRPKSPARKASDTNGTVFLTGATGFLGAYLLSEFLPVSAEVICLVRGASPSEGRARVLGNLARYGLLDPDRVTRLSVRCGDLGLPLLGLTSREFDEVAERADLVVHNGARVNYVMSYEDLRRDNVLGTREAIALACRRSAPFHYVSTLGVFSRIGEGRSEVDAPDDVRDLRTAYVQSKAIAERLVRAAVTRGLPVSIYRPGHVTGDYWTGVTHRDDFFALFVSGIAQCGYAPLELFDGLGIPISPVHMVARAIRRLSTRPRNGDAYHLTVPDACPPRVQFDVLRARGYRVEPCPYGEWLDMLRDLRRRKVPNSLHPLTEWFPRDPSYLVFTDPTSTANTEAALAGSIGEPRSRVAFERFLDFLVSERLLPAPDVLSGRSGDAHGLGTVTTGFGAE
jgi:thioester reductase-like protein